MRFIGVASGLLIGALGFLGCGSDETSSGGSGASGSGIDGGSGTGGSGGSTGGSGGSTGGSGGSTGGSGGSTGGSGGSTGGSAGAGGATPGDVTVHPTMLDDVFANPGMGFADFHLGWWCNLPPITYSPQECADRVRDHWPENYPVAGTAYFRWHWRDLEPTRGQIAFDMIDRALQSANALGETLGFRVMVIDEGGTGLPDWLLAAPYQVAGQVLAGGTFWPDVRDAAFQAEHERFIAALGTRYNAHPALDHVDIGTAGCWGEWNTACVDGVDGLFDVYAPQNATETQEIQAAYESMIDHHIASFPQTPVVMLGIGSGGGSELDVFMHAISGGAGWRVDCWGDWGIWGSAWSHQTDLYPALIANATAADPTFPDVWQHAPVQLEVCGTMPDWFDRGWSADAPNGEVFKTFQWALEQHASVLNAKSTPVPASYVSAVDDLLRENGYRFTIESFNHASSVAAGGDATFITEWNNEGVAPAYLQRAVTYRMRSATDEALFLSAQDVRAWLPGTRQAVDTFTVPSELEPGKYVIEVALLDRAGVDPVTAPLPPLRLAIEGRGADGWYALSELTVE